MGKKTMGGGPKKVPQRGRLSSTDNKSLRGSENKFPRKGDIMLPSNPPRYVYESERLTVIPGRSKKDSAMQDNTKDGLSQEREAKQKRSHGYTLSVGIAQSHEPG